MNAETEVALDTLQQVLRITSSDKYIFKYDINEAMVTYTIECPEVPMGIAVDDDSHDVRRGGRRCDCGEKPAARSLFAERFLAAPCLARRAGVLGREHVVRAHAPLVELAAPRALGRQEVEQARRRARARGDSRPRIVACGPVGSRAGSARATWRARRTS